VIIEVGLTERALAGLADSLCSFGTGPAKHGIFRHVNVTSSRLTLRYLFGLHPEVLSTVEKAKMDLRAGAAFAPLKQNVVFVLVASEH